MSKSIQRPRTGASTLMVVVLLVVITIVTAFVIPGSRQAILSTIGFGSDGKDQRYVTHVARKAPFRIVISENGTVDSMRNSTLFNSVEGSTTIISLVPEGSPVQGPVVAEMDGTVKILEQSSGATAKLKLVRDMDSEAVEEGDGEKEYDVSFGPFTRLLVTDGQKVKKGDYLAGDVVCELDSSSMVEAERQQQIALTEAQANYEKADKNLQIQESTNESLLAQAQLAEELAQLDFLMYTAKDGEYEQALATIQGELKQLEEDLAMAQEEYDYTKRVAGRGYKTQNDLEAARVRVTQKQILLNVKEGAMTVLERFTKERTVKELEQTAADSKRETLRVKLEGEAAMAQMQADYTARKLTLAVEEEKLARLQRQISGCLLIPAQAGQVVYASQNSRRSEPVVIEEGATVRERQAVINLPDLTQMKIDARIHESRINRIALGQRVEVRVDAQPDEIYVGKLKSVSSVPSSGSWPNTDLKEYEAVVEITDSIDRVKTLKPGMTASVDIIVADRAEDVLQIPVQSVLALGNKFFTFVVEKNKKAEMKEIKIGDANAEYMEILEGVSEGDTVVMNPRSHFAEEISAVETKILAEIEQGRDRSDTGPAPGEAPVGAVVPGIGRPGEAAEGGPGGGGPGGGRPGGGGDPASFFKTMDKNGDGVITSDEAPRPEMLERMDGDGDGQVTEEEFRKASASFSGGGGGGGRPGGGEGGRPGGGGGSGQ